VSDANGQLLKVNAEVLLTIYVGGAAIEYDFLVVKSLSVPLMLRWDFQKAYVTRTSPKTQSLTWDNGTVTVAARRWTGNTRDPPPQRGHKPRHHEGPVRYLRGDLPQNSPRSHPTNPAQRWTGRAYPRTFVAR